MLKLFTTFPIAKHFFSTSKVFPSAHEACKDIKSGQSILVGGFGLSGIPENSIKAINKMGLTDLTIVSNNIGLPDFGVGMLLHSKRIKRIISSYVGESEELFKQYQKGEIQMELYPQGTLAEKLRAGGAGIPAFYTATGVSTFEEEGGFVTKFKKGTTQPEKTSQPRPRCTFNGRNYILEEAITGDFSIVKAWKGDKQGNLVFDNSLWNFNGDAVTAGKISIAEVEELVEVGELKPREIHVPGIYVSRIYQGGNYRKSFDDSIVRRYNAKANPLREKIARRAAKEVRDGMYINVGIGIPTLVPEFIEKNVNVFIQSENGLLGVGAYAQKHEATFDLINASMETVTLKPGASIFSSSTSFAMIRGGHLDIAMIGGMEVSQDGDIANWMIPGKRIIGVGGAMDLVSCGKKVIVLMEHVDPKGNPKIVEKCNLPLTGAGVVSQIITDLAVFEIRQKKLVLKEICSKSSVEEIRAKTGAGFSVDENLKKF